MGKDVEEITLEITPVFLNLGCGFNKIEERFWINVDAFDNCQPDVVHDLNKFPYPWGDNSVDRIFISHVLEHLDDWWGAFKEMARILKLGGELEIRVPDESSRTAWGYRDHKHVFTKHSFFGAEGFTHGTNAWALSEIDSVPLKMVNYHQVPFKQYEWMIRWCPNLLFFCAEHFRNFIHEQRFIFRKIGDRK